MAPARHGCKPHAARRRRMPHARRQVVRGGWL